MEQKKQTQSENSTPIDPLATLQLSEENLAWLADLDQLIHVQMGNYDFKVSLIVPHVSLSKRQFERKLKALTGLTPARYVQEIRLQAARTLLQTGQVKSIKELLYRIGIKDHSHFAKKFKARFGKLPSDYLQSG